MIVHVASRAREARRVGRIIVATDDRRIADAVDAGGFEAKLTSPTARSGTDRVAEVAATLDNELIVNIQGDEPLIDPDTIDAAIEALMREAEAQVSTTSEPILEVEDVFNPSVVKVVTDARGFALYFSRSPVPHIRQTQGLTLEEALLADPRLLGNYRKHSGLYAYRNTFLRRFAQMPQSPLEQLEALEQLRALENGARIRVVRVEGRSIGVDTWQDYERAKRLIEERTV